MPTSSEALRRRMLIGYLAILVALYGVAAASSHYYTSSRGEYAAAALGAVGLGLALPGGLRRWRYAGAVACVCAAPMVALLFTISRWPKCGP